MRYLGNKDSLTAPILDIALAKELKVNDSKQISDDMIRKTAPILMNQIKYSLLILDNIKYNKIHDSNNMNQIKARLHNQAYIHLKNKVGFLPKRCIVDQFTPENLYYNYIKHEPTIIKELTFETKAESKYLSVAVASMIARYAFLVAWDKMEAYYECSIPKGAGSEVDVFATQFVKKHGFDELSKIAKMHFKNTDKIDYIYDNVEIGKAVRASMSFPGIYTTCNYGKYNFIDGGTKDNLPVTILKDMGAEKTIALRIYVPLSVSVMSKYCPSRFFSISE